MNEQKKEESRPVNLMALIADKVTPIIDTSAETAEYDVDEILREIFG